MKIIDIKKVLLQQLKLAVNEFGEKNTNKHAIYFSPIFFKHQEKITLPTMYVICNVQWLYCIESCLHVGRVRLSLSFR